jgi:hypothetical protein
VNYVVPFLFHSSSVISLVPHSLAQNQSSTCQCDSALALLLSSIRIAVDSLIALSSCTPLNTHYHSLQTIVKDKDQSYNYHHYNHYYYHYYHYHLPCCLPTSDTWPLPSRTKHFCRLHQCLGCTRTHPCCHGACMPWEHRSCRSRC